MKVNSEYLALRLKELEVSPEKLGEKLGMSGEAIRKIIRSGSTKKDTIISISSILQLDLQKFCPELSVGLDQVDFKVKETGLLERISELEKTVKTLNDSIIDIYKRLPKEGI